MIISINVYIIINNNYKIIIPSENRLFCVEEAGTKLLKINK